MNERGERSHALGDEGSPQRAHDDGIPPRVPRRPPPSIISAGGVDMARAHASNIKPLPPSDDPDAEMPRVVLTPEPDGRHATTSPRIELAVAGGAQTPAASVVTGQRIDKAVLPSSYRPTTPSPVLVPVNDRRYGWLRIGTATSLVVLLIVLWGRSRNWLPPPTPQVPPPVEYVPRPTALREPPPLVPLPSIAVDPVPAPQQEPPAPARADAPKPPAVTPWGRTPATRAKAPPSPSKPAHKPLFELPSERFDN